MALGALVSRLVASAPRTSTSGRRVVPIALLGVAVFLSACADDGTEAADCDVPSLDEDRLSDCDELSGAAGADLPDLALPCLGSPGEITMADISGPAVVNFWGSWCGPCRKEMPVIEDFHQQYGDQVAVVGVAIDTYPEAAADFAVQRDITYPSLLDACGSIEDTALVMKALPQFVFVAEDGSVRQVAGGVESVDDLVDLVDEHLDLDLEEAA